jgi:cell division protein FtsW
MALKLKSDWSLFVVTLTLVLTGVLMVFSSSAVLSKEWYGDPNHFALRHVVAVFLGLVSMFVLMKVNYHRYRDPAVVFSLLSVVTVLLVVAFLMPSSANTHRWIRFGGLSFQPAELGKLALIVFMSYFLEKRKGRVNELGFTLIPVGAVSLLLAGLIVLQPDLGTALSMLIIVGILLFVSGLSFGWFALAGALSVPVLYVLIVLVPWRWERIISFLDPYADPFGAGFQLIQSWVAMGTGGVTGVGFMEGQQKLFYMPEPHTDFIYAVVGEEWGLIGTVLVLVLFGLFLWRGLRGAARAPDAFGFYLALGITMMIGVQAFVNMSVVLGMLPTKGIPLPFISYGGSSFLIMLAAVGILMNVSQQGIEDSFSARQILRR